LQQSYYYTYVQIIITKRDVTETNRLEAEAKATYSKATTFKVKARASRSRRNDTIFDLVKICTCISLATSVESSKQYFLPEQDQDFKL